jgi:hypothetical protein
MAAGRRSALRAKCRECSLPAASRARARHVPFGRHHRVSWDRQVRAAHVAALATGPTRGGTPTTRTRRRRSLLVRRAQSSGWSRIFTVVALPGRTRTFFAVAKLVPPYHPDWYPSTEKRIRTGCSSTWLNAFCE